MRTNSKNRHVTLTQLRRSLNFYVINAAVDQYFTFNNLNLTILYRLTAAGQASAEEELLRKYKSKSALARWDQTFCQRLQM